MLFRVIVKEIGSFRHPVESMEPLPQTSDYREASRRFYGVLEKVHNHVAFAENSKLAMYQVAFAMQAPFLQGRTMESVAAELRVKRQAISKGVRVFQLACGLPGSSYQKSARAVQSYRAARVAQLVPRSALMHRKPFIERSSDGKPFCKTGTGRN